MIVFQQSKKHAIELHINIKHQYSNWRPWSFNRTKVRLYKRKAFTTQRWSLSNHNSQVNKGISRKILWSLFLSPGLAAEMYKNTIIRTRVPEELAFLDSGTPVHLSFFLPFLERGEGLLPEAPTKTWLCWSSVWETSLVSDNFCWASI